MIGQKHILNCPKLNSEQLLVNSQKSEVVYTEVEFPGQELHLTSHCLNQTCPEQKVLHSCKRNEVPILNI